ncbi:MAG: glycosyltransferase [Thermoleophilia bacterium]
MESGPRIEGRERSGESLRVALVTPFSWARPSSVNQHIADLSRELLALGHRPVVLASSDAAGDLLRMRRLMRRPEEPGLELLQGWRGGAAPDPTLLPLAGAGPLAPEDGVPVLALGRSFAFRLNGSVTSIGLPVDVLSRLERLLLAGRFDVVHVHEPFAPSLSFTAIREARSPVVASFHSTPAALVAYELGSTVLARFYTLLDARIVMSATAAKALGGMFGGDYQVISPGTRISSGSRRAPHEGSGAASPARRAGVYVYRGDDSRGLRALMRALTAAFPPQLDRVIVAVHRPSADIWPPRPAPRAVRSRVEWLDFDDAEELERTYQDATVTIAPFLGGEWLLQTVVEALAAGSPVVGPDLPVLRGVVTATDCWACFDPGLEAGLGDAVARALEVAELRTHPTQTLRAGASEGGSDLRIGVSVAPDPASHDFEAVAAAVVDVYRGALGLSAGSGSRGREVGRPERRAARRLRRDPGPEWGPIVAPGGWIHADLHMHTKYSKDCTSPVESVVSTAREVGLGAIAITDHNAIAGALEARELSGEDLIVIVGEEVKTLQGEVIGLFIEELIPGGLSFDETLSRIKGQGGLVYVPHPFDRLRTTPSYRLMVDNLHRIDVIETYNARNMLPQFNLTAERFAAKYNVAAGAGSDAHVLPGLGTAMLRMPSFSGPEGFMAGLREADIVTRRKSLLYLQSLKLLRTTLDHVLPGT